MGILQDPQKAIDQVEWYIDHKEDEQFPGAFEIAAGNLCRQIVEQILFILCFYGRVPSKQYLRSDRNTKAAGQMLSALDGHDPDTGLRYWEMARRRGPRIRKFARHPSTLKKWVRELNEPSHFSTKFRRMNEEWIRSFTSKLHSLLDQKDQHLITTALNDLFSNGKVRASLGNDPENTPGILIKQVVSAYNLERTKEGGLALRGPSREFTVISDTNVPRGPWPPKPVVVKDSVGIAFNFEFVNKHGEPVDIRTGEGILKSFAKTDGERRYLTGRMRQLGFTLSIKEKVNTEER